MIQLLIEGGFIRRELLLLLTEPSLELSRAPEDLHDTRCRAICSSRITFIGGNLIMFHCDVLYPDVSLSWPSEPYTEFLQSAVSSTLHSIQWPAVYHFLLSHHSTERIFIPQWLERNVVVLSRQTTFLCSYSLRISLRKRIPNTSCKLSGVFHQKILQLSQWHCAVLRDSVLVSRGLLRLRQI